MTSLPAGLSAESLPAGTSEATTGLALALYRELGRDAGNVFFSPYSIASALAMVAEGARGATAEEMGRALHLPAAWRQDPADESKPWRTDWFLAGLSELDGALAPMEADARAALEREVRALRQAHDSANAEARKHQEKGDRQAAQRARMADLDIVDRLHAALAELDPYELRVANGMWGERTYPFRDDYLRSVGRFAAGAVHAADFVNQFPAEREKINAWVADRTQGRIPEIVPPLSPDDARLLRLVLVNAIYFKGQWAEPFDEPETQPRDFVVAKGETVRVPTMHAVPGGVRYAAFKGDGSLFETPHMIDLGQTRGLYPDRKGFAVLEMPYQGGRLSMIVVAPFAPDGLRAVESRLTEAGLTTWLGRLSPRSVEVFLPKFRLETDYGLEKTLPALGMRRAFVDPGLPEGADFAGMCAVSDPKRRLYVSRVLHKAFVEVGEKGTEAAAATAGIVVQGEVIPSAQVPFTPVFKADRPFLFLIRDGKTGVILFLGRLTRPA